MVLFENIGKSKSVKFLRKCTATVETQPKRKINIPSALGAAEKKLGVVHRSFFHIDEWTVAGLLGASLFAWFCRFPTKFGRSSGSVVSVRARLLWAKACATRHLSTRATRCARTSASIAPLQPFSRRFMDGQVTFYTFFEDRQRYCATSCDVMCRMWKHSVLNIALPSE